MMEAMITISVVMVGMLGIVTLVSRSLAFNTDATRKFTAIYLAAEGIEVVKNLVDRNYAAAATNPPPTQPPAWDENINEGRYQVQYDSTDLGPELGTSAGDWLVFDASTGLYSYAAGESGGYRRVVDITETDHDEDGFADEIIVRSVVSWSARGVDDAVVLEDHFFNWR